MDSDQGYYPYPSDGGGHHLLALVAIIVLVLIFLSGGFGGGMFTTRRMHGGEREAARRTIYKAVRRAIDKALQARGPEMIIAARHLTKVTNEYLGPFIALGKPAFSSIEAIDKALVGRTPDIPKPGEPHPTHHHAAPVPVPQSASAIQDGSTVFITPPATITNIHLGRHGPDHKAEPPPPPPKPGERDMSLPEQLAALTKAVESLDRAWQPEKVEPFLEAAQNALLRVDRAMEFGRDDHH